MISCQRVYDPLEPGQGDNYLVDRLWPRGIRKETLSLTAWTKDVAPSDELRKWFGHDPAKWAEFKKRYFAELRENPEAWKPLLEAAKKGDICLLFGAHDAEHNNAVALKQFLEAKIK